MDDSFATGRESAIRSYNQGLQAAIQDGMITVWEALAASNWYLTSTDVPPNSPQIDTLIEELGVDDGYLEGFSVNVGVSIGGKVSLEGAAGREIVYNFGTFQRATFRFDQGSSAYAPGVEASEGFGPVGSGNFYYGYIGGFEWDSQIFDTEVSGGISYHRPNYAKFMSQYLGQFNIYSAGVLLPVLGGAGFGGGVTRFSSPDESVFGVSFSISGGVPGPFATGSRAFYHRTGLHEKSYINHNCEVDVQAFEQDIRNGAASPATSDLLLNTRNTAADIARDKANWHNWQVRTGAIRCGC